MIALSASKRLLLPLIALAGLGAQDPRQTPKFTGKSIPDPPQQKEPWTPPRTKLPRFLVSATSALFEQGMADPRGCQYREVDAVEGRTFKTRAFVLPEKPGEPGRFAVGRDGVIRRASSVGPAADLDADIRALADSNAGTFLGRSSSWPSVTDRATTSEVRSARNRGTPSGFASVWISSEIAESEPALEANHPFKTIPDARRAWAVGGSAS
jgi:hypothetical protein